MSTRNISAGRHQFAGWEDAQEYHFENGLTDGLPIVPPTEDRVDAMLDYAGLAPAKVIGTESIRQKHFTAKKVATNGGSPGNPAPGRPVI